MQKNILFVAMFALFSTPTIRPMDDPVKTVIQIAAGGAIVIGVATLGYLAWIAPYICPGCNGAIREEESYVYGSSCTHRFHVGHYAHGTVCQQCLREKIFDESVYQASRNRELEACRVRQLEDKAKQNAEYERLRQQREQAYDNDQQKKAWEIKRGKEEAQRVAQEESRNARGGYVTRAQAKRDQEDAHGHTTAVKIAVEESKALQRQQAEEASRREQEQREQDLQTRQRQVFDHEQATIRSNAGMMKTCTICFCPLAQRDENSEVLLDLKKHPKHVTALPCGDVYHTVCIKKAAQHDNRCPNCRTPFNTRDL